MRIWTRRSATGAGADRDAAAEADLQNLPRLRSLPGEILVR